MPYTVVIFLAIVVILLIVIITVSYTRYRKELMNQDWYDEIYYKFQSTECPHEKYIKFSETNWKFNFTTRRERSVTIQKGLTSVHVKQSHFRFYCEECGKKRWFKQNNSISETKGLLALRLKYIAIAVLLMMFMGYLAGQAATWLL